MHPRPRPEKPPRAGPTAQHRAATRAGLVARLVRRPLARIADLTLPCILLLEGRDAALVGHEELQAEIYRVLCNFVREGRANRLILMHGPNGSAKSTAATCILRALEHYSTLDEGALYRFHWVFPSRKTTRGSIGFGGDMNSRLFRIVRGERGRSYGAGCLDEAAAGRLEAFLRQRPVRRSCGTCRKDVENGVAAASRGRMRPPRPYDTEETQHDDSADGQRPHRCRRP